ncbi:MULTISPECIES: hypothetical protein [Arthrobacter]|uniref:Uncharacterized protein n=1 Tax=Arthrobacter terricola TaxID=2547396 RepID=A0A4R5KXZ9_9MICC|nr:MULTISPECIES: hypothetical protein [Arthrobacter]MBT8160314.1 hypothetical protein [Arthrobacter sp. GN70]TDF99987.1 hypothetical protein E1809_04775 [Arthrobacter terricola]
MFRSWWIVAALVLFFGAAAVLDFGAGFRAKSLAARMEAIAAFVLAAIMVIVGLGWAPFAAVPLGIVIGLVFVSFAVRIFLPGTGRENAQPGAPGRGSAFYGALTAALSAWVLVSAARSAASVTNHPAHQLAVIVADSIGALLMVFAAIGWLLGTFAMPEESKSHAVPRLKGLREAFMAAGLAVALYAVS